MVVVFVVHSPTEAEKQVALAVSSLLNNELDKANLEVYSIQRVEGSN